MKLGLAMPLLTRIQASIPGARLLSPLHCSRYGKSFQNTQLQKRQQCHQRGVATLSPLASAFNARPEKKFDTNLFGRENVGLFCIPELQDYTGFYLLKQNATLEAEQLVSEACNPERSRKLVQVFDHLSDCLCRVADMSDFIRVAHPDHRFSQAAEDACVSISGLVESLNTNVHIHQSLQSVIRNGDKFAEDEIDKRVAQLFMFDFEQSGIHLEETKRERFVKLNENILMLGTHFMHGSQRPFSSPKDQLPEHVRDIFTHDGDEIVVGGLFSDHHSEQVREAAYRLYLHPDHHQLDLLDALLEARNQLANLVEFPTYAHRALQGTTAQTPELTMDFLNTLSEQVRPRAEKDFRTMLEIKKQHSSQQVIMPWDPAYYSAVARSEVLKSNSTELMPYFSLGCCMDGLNMVFGSLYGVKLEYQQAKYGELWSHDVHKIAVIHESEGKLGYIYCDFFERPGKPHQDCHFTIRGGRELDNNTYQDPIVVLLLNLPQPRGHMPSLLTPGMVENLFHEFGHAMHSMLGRTRYQHVTGTRCPTDFAEVPSVLMEYFATDPRILSKFARHWQTGDFLPKDTLENLCRAKRLFEASEMQLQVFYSVLDQQYHGKHPLSGSTSQVLSRVQNQYYSVPYIQGTAWQQRFGHFVGYGAKYYSYLLSRAVASRIWHSFFEKDPFSRSMGERYRSKMLAHGGGKDPAVLIEDMLDEKPTPENLVNALMEDLDSL